MIKEGSYFTQFRKEEGLINTTTSQQGANEIFWFQLSLTGFSKKDILLSSFVKCFYFYGSRFIPPSLTWRPLNFSSGLSTRGRLRRGIPTVASGRCRGRGGGAARWVGWKLLITHVTLMENGFVNRSLSDFFLANTDLTALPPPSPSPGRQRWRRRWWTQPGHHSSGFCARSPGSLPPTRPERAEPGTGWAWSNGSLWPGTSGWCTSAREEGKKWE